MITRFFSGHFAIFVRQHLLEGHRQGCTKKSGKCLPSIFFLPDLEECATKKFTKICLPLTLKKAQFQKPHLEENLSVGGSTRRNGRAPLDGGKGMATWDSPVERREEVRVTRVSGERADKNVLSTTKPTCVIIIKNRIHTYCKISNPHSIAYYIHARMPRQFIDGSNEK